MEKITNLSPKVSVIIPTHNRPQLIRRALKSVLSQTYQNIEVIIIDGSPNNETEKVIQPYLTDSRIRYFHELDVHTNTVKDRGKIAKARNRAVRIAQGKYIAPLDDDDFWCDRDKLEKQIKFLEEYPDYTLCGGGVIVLNEENPQKILESVKLYPNKDEEIRRAMLIGDIFTTSTIVFKKKDWEIVGGYDAIHPLGEDWDFYLKLGKLGKLYNFQEPFVCFSLSQQNIPLITKYGRECVKNAFRIIFQYRNDYPNFYRSLLFNLIIYLYSFLPSPFRKLIRPIRTKIKHSFLKKVGISEEFS